MKINKIEVLGYGKWHDVSFDFNKENLQVIYGNNEAGKTTLLSLIEGILFGYVDGRGSTYEQYIPRETKSYGGKLNITDDNGRNFLITRIAGTHGGDLSIYDIDNDVTESNEKLDDILGPIDRDTFEDLFYFGDLDIKKISKLSKNELVNRIQKVGFVGSDQWLNLRDEFEKESKDLYAPTGRKPPLNQKLKEYDNLTEKISESKNSLSDYNQMISSKNILLDSIKNSKQKISALEKEITKLNHFKQIWPVYQRLSSMDESNFEFKRGFEEEDAKKFNELNNEIYLVNQQIQSIEKSINQLNESMNNDHKLILFNEHKSEIDKLIQSFSKVNEDINQLSVNQSMLQEIKKQNESIANKQDVDIVSNLHNQLMNLSQSQGSPSSNKILLGITGIIVGIIISIFLSTPFRVAGVIVLLFSIIYTVLSLFKGDSVVNDKYKNEELNNKISEYSIKYSFDIDNVEDWISEQKYLINKKHDDSTKSEYESQNSTIINNLRYYFDQWKQIFTDLDMTTSFDEQLSQIRSYMNRMNEENAINLRNNSQLQEYLKKKSLLVDAQIKAKNDYASFLSARNVQNADEFNKTFDIQKQHSIKKAQLDNVKDQITDEDIQSIKKYDDILTINNSLQELNLQIDAERNNLLNNSQELETLNIRLQHMIADGTYNELIQQKSNLETEINQMVDQWMTLKLSNSWIDESLSIATADRIPFFEKKAKEYFSILTNNRYTGITYYKSKIKVTRDDKVQFDAGELSKGTIEQLYLALILSLSVVFGRDYQLPLIIDDGLTEFDQQRTLKAVELLKDISKSIQVIYVTCDSSVLNVIDDNYVLNLNEY